VENKRNGWYAGENGDSSHYLDGRLHREDGPAIIYPDGSRVWYLNGHLHREDGPAIIWPSGSRWWYLNGKEASMETVLDTPEKMEAYLLEESLMRL